MPVWELAAYDTEMRLDRTREYTSSKRLAEAWEKIPRVDFTDSGHGIVFESRPHRGKRRPLGERSEHARDALRAAR